MTNDTAETEPKNVRVKSPFQRLVRCLRWAVVLPLRIVLILPMVILSNACWGISELFEKLGDGFEYCRKVVRPITIMPFVLDWKQQLTELNEKERRRMLKILSEQNDT